MTDVRGDGGPAAGEPAAAPVPGTVTAAVVVVLVEALALVVTAVVLLWETLFGDPLDVVGSLLQAGLAVVGAVVLVACARGVRALRPAARTPLLVLQLLALPVAYSLWFQGDGHPQYGAPIAVLALLTILLLFAPPTRDALDREV